MFSGFIRLTLLARLPLREKKLSVPVFSALTSSAELFRRSSGDETCFSNLGAFMMFLYLFVVGCVEYLDTRTVCTSK